MCVCVYVCVCVCVCVCVSLSLSLRVCVSLSLSLMQIHVHSRTTLFYRRRYALQSGVWSAMGFPVTDAEARKTFYEYANWTYQAGVLVSRSSGTLWTPTRTNLWIMPALQCVFLAFSVYNAYHQVRSTLMCRLSPILRYFFSTGASISIRFNRQL
jgi:hypothetical protein